MAVLNKYYLYYSKLLSVPLVGTALYLLQFFLIKEKLLSTLLLSNKPHPLRKKILAQIDTPKNTLFKKSSAFASSLSDVHHAVTVLDCEHVSTSSSTSLYQLMWSVIHSQFVTQQTFDKNPEVLPANLPKYHPSPTIHLLLKSDSVSLRPPHQAGTERVFLQDLTMLAQHFDEVTGFSRDQLNERVKKLFFPLWLVTLSRWTKAFALEQVSTFLYFLAELMYTVHFVSHSMKTDVLIGYTTPLLALFYPQKTFVVMGNECRFYFSRFFSQRYKNTTFLFCSKFLLDRTYAQYPHLRNNKWQVLYNGVDTTAFKTTRLKSAISKISRLKLLYVSAWTPEKGLELLLDALLLLPPSIQSTIQLTIASNEKLWKLDYASDTEKYVARVNKKIDRYPHVTCLNGVQHHQMPALYSQHDYLVFPSLWDEPFGLAVLEAQSCNLPVICFSTGAIPEIIDKQFNIIVASKSSLSLARALFSATTRQSKAHRTNLIKINSKMTLAYRHSQLRKEINKNLQT